MIEVALDCEYPASAVKREFTFYGTLLWGQRRAAMALCSIEEDPVQKREPMLAESPPLNQQPS